MPPQDDRTDFGFREVPRAQKARLVRGVFDSVAPSYDAMNDLMSLGLHRAWKSAFVAALAVSPRESLLDLASGTGDVALLARRRGAGRVVASDVNEAMLRTGRERAAARGPSSGLEYVVADAERPPFPDRAFDAVSIAFGLRNVTDRAAALREARRVLRPGGRFLCLEFSPRLNVEALRGLYDAWSFRALPAIGGAVAGDAESYRYLAESIRRFPEPEALAAMMRGAGLERVSHRALSGGIVAIHAGRRL